MSRPHRALQRRPGQRRPGRDGEGPDRGDAGVTLVETLVAMGIFSVVMSIFMAAVISMVGSTGRVNNTADASDGVRAAFLRLDRQVRYADALNQPVLSASGNWYVEFRTSQRANGQPTLCTQWRYDPAARVLQYRTWNDGSTPTSTFRTVTTRVRPVAAGASPFTVQKASADYLNQKLTVVVASGAGAGPSAGRASMQTSFVARNSSLSSPSNTTGTSVCPQATRP